jgi:hypothetical protein
MSGELGFGIGRVPRLLFASDSLRAGYLGLASEGQVTVR